MAMARCPSPEKTGVAIHGAGMAWSSRSPHGQLRDSLNWKRGICVHGHFNSSRGFGVNDYYSEIDQFITIIRNPYEMMLSNYFYRKRKMVNGKLYWSGIKYSKEPNWNDLNSYLEIARPYLLKLLPEGITIYNFKDILESRFVYIGLSEDLQGTIDILSKKLGFNTVTVNKVNQSERDEDVFFDYENMFREKFPLEFTIYDYVKQRYKII